MLSGFTDILLISISNFWAWVINVSVAVAKEDREARYKSFKN